MFPESIVPKSKKLIHQLGSTRVKSLRFVVTMQLDSLALFLVGGVQSKLSLAQTTSEIRKKWYSWSLTRTSSFKLPHGKTIEGGRL